MWGLRVEGAGFPPPPFVIAANHHSFLDAPLVGAAYGRRQRFLTLVDLFGNYRLLDWTLRTFEVIEVQRGGVPLQAVRTALGFLQSGGVVSVFPEGIRAVRFGDVPPRRGAAWLAVRSGVPLVAVAVIGTGEVLGTDNRLHRGRVRVVVGPSFRSGGKGREAVDDLHRQWIEWISSVVPGN
jgi:1-acyl-sn-glycerol-3-phosphate acyltransferase